MTYQVFDVHAIVRNSNKYMYFVVDRVSYSDYMILTLEEVFVLARWGIAKFEDKKLESSRNCINDGLTFCETGICYDIENKFIARGDARITVLTSFFRYRDYIIFCGNDRSDGIITMVFSLGGKFIGCRSNYLSCESSVEVATIVFEFLSLKL